jgi:hypothetical protein
MRRLVLSCLLSLLATLDDVRTVVIITTVIQQLAAIIFAGRYLITSLEVSVLLSPQSIVFLFSTTNVVNR